MKNESLNLSPLLSTIPFFGTFLEQICLPSLPFNGGLFLTFSFMWKKKKKYGGEVERKENFCENVNEEEKTKEEGNEIKSSALFPEVSSNSFRNSSSALSRFSSPLMKRALEMCVIRSMGTMRVSGVEFSILTISNAAVDEIIILLSALEMCVIRRMGIMRVSGVEFSILTISNAAVDEIIILLSGKLNGLFCCRK
ncbi:hypothetical protein CEXT_218641 [Caerostris extrusa]|uniref:Uncharacterized protein n=1 Tax=Caerostris extrusa TaxID=172846 RepID=A0AAV4MK91_CAEEX|nr:hypothetical protein CEXT_218641 [Caerostris extrusa]